MIVQYSLITAIDLTVLRKSQRGLEQLRICTRAIDQMTTT